MEKVFSNSMKDNMSHLPPTNAKTIIPSKLEVVPNALKMLDGVGKWMDGYP